MKGKRRITLFHFSGKTSHESTRYCTTLCQEINATDELHRRQTVLWHDLLSMKLLLDYYKLFCVNSEWYRCDEFCGEFFECVSTTAHADRVFKVAFLIYGELLHSSALWRISADGLSSASSLRVRASDDPILDSVFVRSHMCHIGQTLDKSVLLGCPTCRCHEEHHFDYDDFLSETHTLQVWLLLHFLVVQFSRAMLSSVSRVCVSWWPPSHRCYVRLVFASPSFQKEMASRVRWEL